MNPPPYQVYGENGAFTITENGTFQPQTEIVYGQSGGTDISKIPVDTYVSLNYDDTKYVIIHENLPTKSSLSESQSLSEEEAPGKRRCCLILTFILMILVLCAIAAVIIVIHYKIKDTTSHHHV